MHGHEPALPEWLVFAFDLSAVVFVVWMLGLVLFFMEILPIPVGYERGKIKWVMFCGTGMHAHIVYWTERGFQTLHPADQSENTP